MSQNLVPLNTRVAAKRGFIRTTAQAYAATIPAGGVTATTILTIINDPDPALLVSTGLAALLSPVLAGAASYLQILSAGIPEDYAAALPVGRHYDRDGDGVADGAPDDI